MSAGSCEPRRGELAQRGDRGRPGPAPHLPALLVEPAIERRRGARHLESAAAERGDARVGAHFGRDPHVDASQSGPPRAVSMPGIATEARLGDHRGVAHKRDVGDLADGIGQRGARAP